ncbi:MAG: hypothetical protein AB7S70_02600 [Hyphomicrobium sp.]|uniref:hypothetical protein n=1 Tax=Hyphomicrobium sp. TaxID=82 RepID=UPI003D0E51AA
MSDVTFPGASDAHSASAQGPRKGKIRAAWQPGAADEVWYPVTCKLAAGVPVRVALEDPGYTVLALIKKHPARKTWWWYQVGVWGDGGWMRRQEIALAPVGAEPPWDLSPRAFSPLNAEDWPYPLPAPLDPAFGRRAPRSEERAPDEGVDAAHGTDDWPHPGLLLTRGVPRSREECEARLLRAFRTSDAQHGVGHGGSSTCADIPREMVLIALKYAAREREAEERRGKRDTDATAVRSGWTPTRRDLEDWVTALSWLNGVEGRAIDVVAMRAADPPWSFRQIAEKVRARCHKTARHLYERALDQAYTAALRMPTSHPRPARNGG